MALVSLCTAAIYSTLTAMAVVFRPFFRGQISSALKPPVTILKPLCGAEPGLYEHLRSFCVQEYSPFEIVFGVRDPTDPACAVVARLMSEFPALVLKMVINPQLHGTNLKISNLINMLPHAANSVLVIADSDAFATPDYLGKVTAPLADETVGLVTCAYRDVPTPLLWSRLGAMYINEWYIPSVLLARLFGHQSYVSGQTVCMRRETLEKFGGFQMLANHLADDYRLGECVRMLGLRIVLSSYMVDGEHHETSIGSVIRHELRWMRTLRVLRPASFRWLFLTFSLPLAVLGLVSALVQPPYPFSPWPFVAATAGARLTVHLAHRLTDRRRMFADLWLLPLRDGLLCWVWCRSFFESHVTWRGNVFDVGPDGVMHQLSDPVPRR